LNVVSVFEDELGPRENGGKRAHAISLVNRKRLADGGG
jgi:hypothetical protein